MQKQIGIARKHPPQSKDWQDQKGSFARRSYPTYAKPSLPNTTAVINGRKVRGCRSRRSRYSRQTYGLVGAQLPAAHLPKPERSERPAVQQLYAGLVRKNAVRARARVVLPPGLLVAASQQAHTGLGGLSPRAVQRQTIQHSESKNCCAVRSAPQLKFDGRAGA